VPHTVVTAIADWCDHFESHLTLLLRALSGPAGRNTRRGKLV
jgi:hypothetical protein